VIAVGAQPNTFGIPGVDSNAMFLKEVADSKAIRNKVVDQLETASLPGQSDQALERLLHFVVVGGGPTGVEFAAELHDFLSQDIPRAFPLLPTEKVKITLFEATPTVLSMFDASLQDYTEEVFKRVGIDVRKRTAVTAVPAEEITVRLPPPPPPPSPPAAAAAASPQAAPGSAPSQFEAVPYGLMVWVAGIGVRPLVCQLKGCLGGTAQSDPRGLAVDERLQVVGTGQTDTTGQTEGQQGKNRHSRTVNKHIWALGDCSVSGNPPTAQVASQEGRYLGRLFNSSSTAMRQAAHATAGTTAAAEAATALTEALAADKGFHYAHQGSFAYVGDKHAIAEIPTGPNNIQLSGTATYAAWRAVYFSKLLSIENRCLVSTDWLKTSAFGRDTSRE
jgi:NADH:ubiquinone reductase (non-electrogenic)